MPRSQNVFSRSTAIYTSLYARSVNISKGKRKLGYRKSYCTSSKRSDIDVSKERPGNFPSRNIFSLIWRSVTDASSVIRQSVTSSRSGQTKELISKLENMVSVQRYSKLLKPYLKLRTSTVDKNQEKVAENLQSEFKEGGPNDNKEHSDQKIIPLERAASELIANESAEEKKNLQNNTEKKPENIPKNVIVSRSSLESRSRFLVRSLASATSHNSQILRLEEVIKHLLLHPQEKSTLVQEGLIRIILHLKRKSHNTNIATEACKALSLLGYHDPPGGRGIRILTIDGGGTRGLMAIEILRQLQARTGKGVHEMFDYICGVSSGAILTFLMGALRLSPDECETLYKELSTEVFKQSAIWGTGRLMWYHAYYDTTLWVKILRKTFGDKVLVDSIKENSTPKLAAVSAVMNLPTLRAFVFRNYDYPIRAQSQFIGGANHKMWEAVRASGAAPGYFEEINLGGLLHQDGGILMNNPTALAIHEARLLWPSDYIQCVFSLGNGRFIPVQNGSFTSTTLKTKVQKMIDSATDTEAVHISLNDLLPPGTYFRFNPYLTEFLHLDENRPEKLHQLQMDTQMYLRRNEHKLEESVKVLTQSRNSLRRLNDWFQLQQTLLL